MVWGSARVPSFHRDREHPSHASQHMQSLHYLGSRDEGLDFSVEVTKMQVPKIVGIFT